MDAPNKVKEFELINPEKADRALNGTLMADSSRKGGVVKSDGTWDDDALLAEYDRLGGLIRKGGDKVKTGSFYDFKAKKPFADPKVFYEFRVNDKLVFVPEGKELPGEVKAAKILEEEEKVEKPKRGRKPKEE